MASEFFSVGGSKLAITITPGDSGVLTVVVDGEKIFDKAGGDGHPNLDRVKELKAIVKDRVAGL
ncbi:Rdx family protein [Dehalococcoidia bacterium]|jgi:predicted Rdx family selenoprotein|nr:Rdx family protein [Dehalococcoidia bacterium]